MKIIKIVLRIFAVFSLAFCIFALLFANMALSPCSNDTKKVLFEIENGDSTSESIAKLSRAGLIKNKFVFNMLYVMSGRDGLKKGTYEISPSMPPIKILQLFLKGSSPPLVKSTVKKKL